MNPKHKSADLTEIDSKMHSETQSERSETCQRPSAQCLLNTLSFEHDEIPQEMNEKDLINKHFSSLDTIPNTDPETRPVPSYNPDLMLNHSKPSKDTKRTTISSESCPKLDQTKDLQNKLSTYLNSSSDLSVSFSLQSASQSGSESPNQSTLSFLSHKSRDSIDSTSSKQALSTSTDTGTSINSSSSHIPYVFSNISEVPESKILERSLTLKTIQESYREAQKDNTIEEVDVLCVNCYECIPIDQVDTHSNLCCKPVAVVPELEDDLDLRIRKLMTAMQERQSSYRGDKVRILLQLQEIAHSVLENSLSLDTILHNLEVIATHSICMLDGYSCTIFARRLAVLAECKSSDLPRDMLRSSTTLFRHYEEEVARQRQELEKWKLRNELLSQLAIRTEPTGYIDIDSDVDGDIDKCSVYSSSSEITDAVSNLGDIEV